MINRPIVHLLDPFVLKKRASTNAPRHLTSNLPKIMGLNSVGFTLRHCCSIFKLGMYTKPNLACTYSISALEILTLRALTVCVCVCE